MTQVMAVKKDLKCTFNMPKKLSSRFNENGEAVQSLPPYSPTDAYPVDEYEACPTNWMHGSDIASSYFVGVEEDHAMWLDFNECCYHTHDVAVVISIQGINPITGQKMVAEKALKLEQYHKKCPIHGTKFQQDRFCKKCGFKWPGQNYLATTGTPDMMLWLDGFRAPDGKVRQYIFTEDKMRGVAAQKIGKDRVFAIGIAYYLSNHKKPYVPQCPEQRSNNDNGLYSGGIKLDLAKPMFFSPLHSSQSWVMGSSRSSSSTSCYNTNNVENLGIDDMQKPDIVDSRYDRTVYQLSPQLTPEDQAYLDANPNVERFYTLNEDVTNNPKLMAQLRVEKGPSVGKLRSNGAKKGSVKPITPVKQLEIGAGALVRQDVYDDPKMISYWEKKPAGMIYINYCDEETKKKILDGGRRADQKDGFMQDLKVGG